MDLSNSRASHTLVGLTFCTLKIVMKIFILPLPLHSISLPYICTTSNFYSFILVILTHGKDSLNRMVVTVDTEEVIYNLRREKWQRNHLCKDQSGVLLSRKKPGQTRARALRWGELML